MREMWCQTDSSDSGDHGEDGDTCDVVNGAGDSTVVTILTLVTLMRMEMEAVVVTMLTLVTMVTSVTAATLLMEDLKSERDEFPYVIGLAEAARRKRRRRRRRKRRWLQKAALPTFGVQQRKPCHLSKCRNSVSILGRQTSEMSMNAGSTGVCDGRLRPTV